MTTDELWRQMDALQFKVTELTAKVEQLAAELRELKVEREKHSNGI
jgi:hypothetical protein